MNNHSTRPQQKKQKIYNKMNGIEPQIANESAQLSGTMESDTMESSLGVEIDTHGEGDDGTHQAAPKVQKTAKKQKKSKESKESKETSANGVGSATSVPQ